MKYSETIVKKICKNLSQGNTITATCDAVGISKVTFYDWIDKKPNFSNRIKKTQAKAINVVETALFKMATGQFQYLETHEERIIIKGKEKNTPAVLKKTIRKTLAPNPTAFIFYLVNQSDEWENIQVTKHTGKLPIEIGAEELMSVWEKFHELKAKEKEKTDATTSKNKPGGKKSESS